MSDIISSRCNTLILSESNNPNQQPTIKNNNNEVEDLQRIKSAASSSNLSIAEYISIQSSNATNTSSPIFTENSSSNSNNLTNMTNNSSKTNIISKSSSTNTTISQHSTSNLINGKPIIFNSINNLLCEDLSTQPEEPQRDIDLNKDLFYCIDRKPAYPPNYYNVNAVKSIRYPIYESTTPIAKDTQPPRYTPSINKITIASLKMERISPYEPATSRSWKDYIVEINSTQLNFYSIQDNLNTEIKKIKSSHPTLPTNNSNNIHSTSSSHHSPQIKKSNGFFSSVISKETQNFDLDEQDQEKICAHINRNKSRYMTTHNLFKTYSLQYGKYGIPIDYDKKPFVLRLRCESEQFLVNFSHIDDMINWAMYLSIGISVSLDLDFRELPDYRVVPRRRRRRRRRHGNKKKRLIQRSRRRRTNTLMGRGHDISSSSYSAESQLLPQNKSRSYSLSSMKSGSNPTSFLRSSNLNTIHQPTVPEYRSPENLNDIGKILSLPSDDNVNSLSYDTANLALNPTNTRSTFALSATNTKTGSTFTSPRTNTLSSRSRSNSSMGLNLSFKSKMKSLFKSSKSLSNDNKSKSSIKFGSFAMSTSSYAKNEQIYARNRSMSTPVISSTSTNPTISTRQSTPKNSTTATTKDRRHRERKITQSVINEIHEHHRSHHHEDSDEEEEIDDDDDNEYDNEYDSTDDHLTDDGDTDYDDHFNNTTDSNLSIYAEEGLLDEDGDEDNDDDDDDEPPLSSNTTMDSSAFERRLHNMAAIEYASYESDDVKWVPDKKEMSRRRYIRDSLRCIRPFVEDQEWIGHVVFRPTCEPKFDTNNRAIWVGNNDGKRRFKYISGSDFSNVKNHYLKAYVVGPVGFLKTETKVVTTPLGLPL
ncbi:hypothetical protein MOUN0_I08636 [Monosporozyma unispora]